MKVTRLSRAALDAELLRLRCVAKRTVRRAIFAAAAGLVGLFAFVALHFAAFFVLHLDADITPAWSTVIVASGDGGCALILLLLARSGRPGAVEVEARNTRDRALTELRTSAAIATVTGPIGRYAGRGAFGVARRVVRRRRR